MKKVRILLMLALTVLMTVMSAVAMAAPDKDNPFKDYFETQAKAMRSPGKAQVIYMIYDTNRAPLEGATLIYNTSKGKNLEAVADSRGMIKFETTQSEIYFVQGVIVGGTRYPVSGKVISDVELKDVRKGDVDWYVIHRFSSAGFMSYDAD